VAACAAHHLKRAAGPSYRLQAVVFIGIGNLFNKINGLQRKDRIMRIVYNSEQYYVAEYPGQQGLELVDKRSSRGTYFQGDVAEKFANAMNAAVSEDASEENIDAFLDNFSVLLNSPVVYH